MHPVAAEKIVEICRQRSREGDCPTVDAPGRETLEFALVEIASQRDRASADALKHLANAMQKVMPDLADQVRQRWTAKMEQSDAALVEFLQSISER